MNRRQSFTSRRQLELEALWEGARKREETFQRLVIGQTEELGLLLIQLPRLEARGYL